MDATPTIFDRANLLATGFAARAGQHDREASFPFENFQELAEAGLLALTVPADRGGRGAGVREAGRVLNILAKADASTALVLSMHYIHHLMMARSGRWPPHLAEKLTAETLDGVRADQCVAVEPSSRIWARPRVAGCPRPSPDTRRTDGG